MKLTPEQLFRCWQRAQRKVIPGEADAIDCLTAEINAELREMLDAAPVVYEAKLANTAWMEVPYRPGFAGYTGRSARLVCIEELKR